MMSLQRTMRHDIERWYFDFFGHAYVSVAYSFISPFDIEVSYFRIQILFF